MQTIRRAFKTTGKQIQRSGWLSWASIAVMTLAFLITTIFLGLAFIMNLVLRSIENEPHIYIFYKPGTIEASILETKTEWEKLPNIKSIDYTSEAQAFEEFRADKEKTNPLAAEAIREDVLPASMGIRLINIEAATDIIDLVKQEQVDNADVYTVGYSKDTIKNIENIVSLVRIVGAIVLGIQLVVILLFTLLTVEFRIFNRAEEIGIMQLVGGSLWYIRMPFILEGAYYGIIGAILSNLIIFASYLGILRYFDAPELQQFLTRFFGKLDWPTLTLESIVMIIGGLIATGGFIGIINSYIAIRRYIK